jgi:photosystem II stability/assembly factor-like uncharacterized protein
VGPDDGLNELLPVASTGEEKHKAERPDEVCTQKQETVGTTRRPVGLNDLACLRPQEVP